MKNKSPTSFDELLAELEKDEEYRKADRQIKPYYELIKAIVKRRIELGFTQKDLAEKAQTHQSRISKIESAEHDIRFSTLIQIAEALDAEVSVKLLSINKPILFTDGQNADYLFKLVLEFSGVASEGKANEYSVSEDSERIYDQKITLPV